MKMFDDSEPIQAVASFTMDYPEMKEKFPILARVVYVGRTTKGGLTWGKISSVLGYSPITPALRITGNELSQNPVDYEVLGERPTCVHGGYIQGGDCRDCAQEKHEAIIDSGEAYSFESDPYYQELVEASKAKGFRAKTADILADVEGSGNRPFANQRTALAYIKAITGLNSVVTAPYYANYLEAEAQAIMSRDELLENVRQILGFEPEVKDYRDDGYISKSWIWRLDNDRTVQVLYWSPKKPFGVRLYNNKMDLFY